MIKGTDRGVGRENGVPLAAGLDGLLDKQRAAMYRQIVENHARLEMVLQRCPQGQKIKDPNAPQLQLGLSFFIHLEHSLHFLAGEILEIKAFLRKQCENKTEGSGEGCEHGLDADSQKA